MKIATVTARHQHLLDIIRLLYQKGEATKADLARMTDLTTASTNSMINVLLEQGIVAEAENARQTGGRNSSVYRLNHPMFRILGIQIRVDGLRCVVQDLNMHTIEFVRYDSSMEYVTAEAMVDKIVEMVGQILEKAKIELTDLLICSVIVPGNVDFRKGIVLDPPGLKAWKSIPLKAMMESKLKISTVVENDNNAQALACKWKGYIDQDADAVCVGLDGGIGVGILTNGYLYRGFRGIAGELGHITVKKDGELCRCGNRGCLELYAMEQVMHTRICNGMVSRKHGILWEKYGASITSVPFNEIVDAAVMGDEIALDEFERSARYMAVGLSTLIKIIAPRQVVLVSSWLDKLKSIYYDMLEQVYKSCSFIRQSDLTFQVREPAEIFDMATCATAVELMLNDASDNPLLKMGTGM